MLAGRLFHSLGAATEYRMYLRNALRYTEVLHICQEMENNSTSMYEIQCTC